MRTFGGEGWQRGTAGGERIGVKVKESRLRWYGHGYARDKKERTVLEGLWTREM